MSWSEGVNSTLNLHSNTFSSLVCTNLYDHRPVARVLMSLHYSLVFMLGLLGNALALHVIRPNLAQINSTTLYSANLAASDVLFTLALPLRIAYYALGFHWPLGETLCRVTALLFYVNTYAGVNFMTCLAVDRFIAVVLPLRYTRLCRARTVRYVCLGVWVLVLVQTLPLLSVTMTRAEPDGTTTCMEYPNFENGAVEGLPYVLIGAVVMGYGIPVATILCCYLVLLWKLRLVTRSGVGGRGHRSLRSGKATGVIAGVVLVFVVCFSPYHINILQYMIRKLRYTPDCTELQAFQMSLHFTVCLMNFNCCLDPFVYFFACKGYKRRVMKMLRVQVSASFSSMVRTGDGRSRLGSHTACPVALDDALPIPFLDRRQEPHPANYPRDRSHIRPTTPETGATSGQLPQRQEPHPANYPRDRSHIRPTTPETGATSGQLPQRQEPHPANYPRDRSHIRPTTPETGATSGQLPLRQEPQPANYP